jgi:hypothetical protein
MYDYDAERTPYRARTRARATGRQPLVAAGAALLTLTALGGALVAAIATQPRSGAHATASPYLGLVNLGMPTAPQPFMSDTLAITKHERQSCNDSSAPPWDGGTCSMQADHGAACDAPPATHSTGEGYAGEVFVCHDHLMTAFNAAGAGVIAFQPNQLVDFSGGAATVAISRSTRITSGRDYTEFYFVPFEQQLAYSADANIGESEKQAQTFIRVFMGTHPGSGNTFNVTERVNGVDAGVPGNNWQTVEQATGLVDSAVTRTPITMTISQTHFTLASNGFTFYDAALPIKFPVSQAVFQVQHASYDPTKNDEGAPDTWHWSNLAISSAVPYYQQMAMPEAAGDYSGLTNRITFAAAPAGAFLRFQGYNRHWDSFGGGYDISFDNGATWAPWHLVSGTGDNSLGSFWQSIPTGATSALLRGSSGWYARDFYVMALGGASAAQPVAPTATGTMPTMPMGTPSPTEAPPASSPAPAPLPINGVPCTVTINGVTRNGTCTGTFTPA